MPIKIERTSQNMRQAMMPKAFASVRYELKVTAVSIADLLQKWPHSINRIERKELILEYMLTNRYFVMVTPIVLCVCHHNVNNADWNSDQVEQRLRRTMYVEHMSFVSDASVHICGESQLASLR